MSTTAAASRLGGLMAKRVHISQTMGARCGGDGRIPEVGIGFDHRGQGPAAAAGLAAMDGIVADNRVHGQVVAAVLRGPSPAQRPRADAARSSSASGRGSTCSARGAVSAEKRDEVKGYFSTVSATSRGPL
eukprot:875021-Pyramimonas_sp.AAC.1